VLDYTIFASKNSRSVNLRWLHALHDLERLGDWSWGRLTLAFMYEQLSLTSDSADKAVGGYITLLVVLFFFLIFLMDHKCIFVCMILVLI